jgi:vitamin B12 transporter
MTTLNSAVDLRPIRYWIKDMKKTLSLSAIMLMTTSPVFAQDAILLEEIVVNATLTPTEAWKSGATITRIDQTTLDNSGSTSIASTLKATPGVSMTQSGTIGGVGYLSIRGLGAAYVAVQKDGIDVTDPSSLKTQYNNFSSLSTNDVAAVEILKGTQSAIYGSSAIAGVVNVSSLDLDAAPAGQRQIVDLSFGTNNTTSGRYTYTNVTDRFSLGFAASGYKSDGLSSASTRLVDHSTGKNNSEADGFDSTSFTVAATAQLTDKVKIGATVIKENSTFQYDEWYTDDNDTVWTPAYDENDSSTYYWLDDVSGPVDGTTDEYGTRDAIGARVFAEYSMGSWVHRLNITGYEIKRFATSPTVSGPDSESITNTFKGSRNTIQYIASGSLAANMDASFGIDTKRDTSVGSSVLSGEKSTTTNGIFAEVQYQPTENWSIVANLRQDTHSDFGAFTSSRLATAYKVTETTVIRAQKSTGFRAPSIDELYGNYPNGSYPTAGNPNLKPETFETTEVSLDQYLDNGGRLSITLYETLFSDKIDYVYGNPNSYDNKSKAKTTGTEIALAFPLSDMTRFGVALSNNSSENVSGNRAAGRSVSMTLDHRFTDKLSASAQMLSVADQPYDGLNGGAREDYQIMNVSAAYQVNDQLSVYGKVENIADYAYETEVGYSSPRRMIAAGIRASF